VTFAMIERCKYVIANDSDEEVFNLFITVKEHRKELENAIRMMPVHDKLFKYWKKQEEHDCVWKATRFLLLSNFGYMGKPDTLHFGLDSPKSVLLNSIESTFERLNQATVKFSCADFRDVLKAIAWRQPERDKSTAFVYADPPYLGTGNNYQKGFTEQDTVDLFDILVSSGIRFAVSEFDNPFIDNLVESYSLNIFDLGERQNMKNRKKEVLITNYKPVKYRQVTMFDVLNHSAGRYNNGLVQTAPARCNS